MAVTLLAVAGALGVTVYGMFPLESLMVAALQSAGLVLALRFPRWGVTIATFGAIGALSFARATAEAPWPVQVTTLLALLGCYALASLQGRWLATSASAVVVGVTASGIASAAGSTIPAGPMVANLIVLLALSTITIGITTLVRAVRAARGELAEARELSELELARRQIAEERTRIAREMHDVVAHGMSVIQVQAASARYRFAGLDDAVADEFDELAATARTALGEMRALLGVLRADDGAEHAPQPGLADLAELVARSRAVFSDELPAEIRARIDPVCQLAVYRVVQESLGNAARHAAGATTSVTLAAAVAEPGVAPSVRVIVRNAAPPADAAPRSAPDPSGHGIRGMRERVSALGGSLAAAPTPDGGFQVRAVLPVAPGTPLADSAAMPDAAPDAAPAPAPADPEEPHA